MVEQQSDQRYHYLLQGFLQRSLTPSELMEFYNRSIDPQNLLSLEQQLDKDLHNQTYTGWSDATITAKVLGNIIHGKPVVNLNKSDRIRTSKTTWLRYAAAAILVLAIGSGIYYFSKQSSTPNAIIGGTRGTGGTRVDIAPGGNKAIWTLTDGKKIELDSTILDMTAKSQSLETNGYNELSTPRGGQYQLILPDGSKVWLNAASSIKYPVEFSGKERRVEINGEVYFEIAKDATKPFRVSAGEQEIEVLGTSFNVNAYSDEPIIKTTLLTGSIKLTNNNQTVILKPNQQAQIINSSLLIINSSSDVLAWKNGLFSFTGKNLETIMREIARWYNIEILYPNGVPDLEILGGAQRNVSLQKLLTFFKESDLHFTMQGDNILIVTK